MEWKQQTQSYRNCLFCPNGHESAANSGRYQPQSLAERLTDKIDKCLKVLASPITNHQLYFNQEFEYMTKFSLNKLNYFNLQLGHLDFKLQQQLNFNQQINTAIQN
ncbi:Hypothetical_protein [Hexamita inflata]|uniref:Hypothetical_protein n=1 Tax=Hexamita inflata TaxID=28002 RepID=A0AA86QBB1_9EUKA|nr:Hypothetical protein HINF_LOCUS40542 [Hexamita inflata]